MTCVWKIKIEKIFLYILCQKSDLNARKVIFINDSAILYLFPKYKHLHVLVEPLLTLSLFIITLFCHYLKMFYEWIRQNAEHNCILNNY